MTSALVGFSIYCKVMLFFLITFFLKPKLYANSQLLTSFEIYNCELLIIAISFVKIVLTF